MTEVAEQIKKNMVTNDPCYAAEVADINVHRSELIDPLVSKLGGRIVKFTGDGVNIAARLEGLSEANGVPLSDDAYRQVRDRLDADWKDSGEHKVKNIVRPVHVLRWASDHGSEINL